jgi:hypothetical protein
MQIKAKVTIQTPGKMHAPGDIFSIDKAEGEKLIASKHAELVSDEDPPAPLPESTSPSKTKAKAKPPSEPVSNEAKAE